MEPMGGSTTGGGPGFVQTRYPDGAYYQRYDVPAHGHGYNLARESLSLEGEVVPPTSPEAHWPAK